MWLFLCFLSNWVCDGVYILNVIFFFQEKKPPYHKETILQAILIRDETPASLPPSKLVKGVRPTDSSYNASLGFGGDKDDCTGVGKILECLQTIWVSVLDIIVYLRWGDFDVNNNWGQWGLEELRWVVDGVRIQHNQLQGPRQLEDPLDLTLHLGWWDKPTDQSKKRIESLLKKATQKKVKSWFGARNMWRSVLTQAGASVGPFYNGPFTGVVQNRPLGQWYICSHSCDGDPEKWFSSYAKSPLGTCSSAAG